MADSNENQNNSNRISLLYQLSAQLAMSLDLQTTLEQVIKLAVQYLDTERGSLVVLDPDHQPIDAVLYYHGRTIFNNAAQFVDIVKRGLIAWVIREKDAAFINNTAVDPRWLKRADDDPEQTGAKSAMCIPIEARGQLVGILTIVHPEPDYFSLEQFEFLKAVADQSSIAISNALLFDQQEALHQQFYELFQDSITPILITNSTGQILQANEAALQLIGLQNGKLISHSIYDLHQAPVELLGEDFSELITGHTKVYESTLSVEGKSKVPIRISVRMLLRDLSGKLQWIIEDISAEKELQAIRNDLSAMIYHDIRSPLANVISSLEMLKLMLPDHGDQNINEILSVISRSTNRVQRLVSNLLDIDRLEDEEGYITIEEIDIRDLIQSVISDVKPTLDSRDQTLNLHIAPSIEEVWADEDMLKRVIINLLENAAKYSPMNETITFKVERFADGTLRFCVADNGPGIPTDQLESIFEKFTRVSSRKGPKGIGLGLAYCKLALDAHGGNIWAESDGEKGTRFIFELPNHPLQS